MNKNINYDYKTNKNDNNKNGAKDDSKANGDQNSRLLVFPRLVAPLTRFVVLVVIVVLVTVVRC
jgi:hypothetical protein